MFESTPRVEISAIASAVKAKQRHQTPSEFALTALQVMFVAITVLLFVAWLTPSNSQRSTIWGFAPESNCVSVGRGGVDCTRNSAIDNRSNKPFGSDEDCKSLGRGGLVCKEHLGDVGHSS
jgi:hypothetical protein